MALPRESPLARFVRLTEEAADGLHRFRDELPHDATRITAVVGQLFGISSALRELDIVRLDQRQKGQSFHLLRDDLRLVFPTLKYTLDACFDMFADSSTTPCQIVWDDFNRQMDVDEGTTLLDRLQWYYDFLRALCDVSSGRRASHDIMVALRRRLVAVTDVQEESLLRTHRRLIEDSVQQQQTCFDLAF